MKINSVNFKAILFNIPQLTQLRFKSIDTYNWNIGNWFIRVTGNVTGRRPCIGFFELSLINWRNKTFQKHYVPVTPFDTYIFAHDDYFEKKIHFELKGLEMTIYRGALKNDLFCINIMLKSKKLSLYTSMEMEYYIPGIYYINSIDQNGLGGIGK